METVSIIVVIGEIKEMGSTLTLSEAVWRGEERAGPSL